MIDKRNEKVLKIKKSLTLSNVRGHSTTTWTRRGGGGVSKKSTLVHPGGVGVSLDVHVD